MSTLANGRRPPDGATLTALAAGLGLCVFLTVLVHEVLGHGLVAVLAGGRFLRVQVGVFHGHAWFDGVHSPGWRVAVDLGGMAVTLAMGTTAVLFAGRVRSLRAEVPLRMLGAVSLASGFGYLGLGSLLGQGDPMAIVVPGGDVARALALGPVGLAAAGLALLTQHRRLMARLGAPERARPGARFRFGVACWAPGLVLLAGLELTLASALGAQVGAWLWAKLAAILLAGVALASADAFLPGASAAGPAAPPLRWREAFVAACAWAGVVALLASGLYAGWEL